MPSSHAIHAFQLLTEDMLRAAERYQRAFSDILHARNLIFASAVVCCTELHTSGIYSISLSLLYCLINNVKCGTARCLYGE